MSASIAWIHIGDLHMDEADGWASRPRLAGIVEEINAHAADADLVFLPGDNANHASPDQYRAIVETLEPLAVPWRAIPGDHDFEGRSLEAYRAAFDDVHRPEVEVIAGHRCIFVDVVSAGTGGPDFRLTTHHRHRVARELALAEAERQTAVVFMHAYPGDLAAHGEELARQFADARVAFVDTGHTHYNELLNDGRVIYGATRSTAQIEEGDGVPGYSIVCVHESVPSWRFRPLGGPWPHVQVLATCDLRLVTRPTDPRHVPRLGDVQIVARVFGLHTAPPRASIDGGPELSMSERASGFWHVSAAIRDPGLHRIVVNCDGASDCVGVLVRDVQSLPKRVLPVAPGHACHAIGAWHRAGIDGMQRGPNRNGRDW